MYLVAGVFIAYYAVMVYSELYEPRRIGIRHEFLDRRMVLTEVTLASPAGRTGLKAGDCLLAVDGATIRQWEDWNRFVVAREIGANYRLEIERAGQRSEFSVTLAHKAGDPLGRLERKRYVQFILLLLALILGFIGHGERGAQIGALFLAAVGTAPLFPGAEMTAVWRNLPVLPGAALWIPQVTHLMLLPLFFTFFALFPMRLFRNRWPWLVVWGPAVIVACWCSPHIYHHIYNPTGAAWVSAGLCFILGCAVLIYGGGALTALAVNYHRSREPENRRCMQILVAGSFIGLIPSLLFLVALFWGTLTQSEIVWFFVSTPYKLTALGLFLAFPLSFAYALSRRRTLKWPEDSIP